MVEELEHKYEVKIKSREGRQKLPDDVKERIIKRCKKAQTDIHTYYIEYYST